MAEILRGLQGPELLGRLLGGAHGQAPGERPGARISAGNLAEILRSRGRNVRPTRIRHGDLAFLEPGTLLETREGGWLILGSMGPRACRVATADGEATLPPAELFGSLSGLILDLSPGLGPEGPLWRRVARLVLGFGRPLRALVYASLAMQILAMAVPFLTALAMDRALPDGAASLLSLVALGVLFASGFQALLGWTRQRTLLFLQTRLEMGIQLGFLEHTLALPFPALDRKGRAELLQAFFGLDSARELMTDRLLGSVLDAFMAVIYLAAMFLVFPKGAGVVLGVAGVMAGVALGVGNLQAGQQRLEVAAQARQRGFLVELLSGISTVKSAGAETWGHGHWLGRLGVELGISLRRQRLGLGSEIGLETLRQGVLIGILVWGGRMVLHGGLSIGSLFAFVQMATSFLGAALSVSGLFLTVVLLRPQVAKAVDILEMEVQRPKPRRGLADLPGPLVMEDVWFRYAPDRPWVLRGFNLTVEPGARRWLQAPSGTGKSTILRLLAGLYPPTHGSIRLGDLEPAEAKELILYLPQSFQPYGGTIRDNLRLLSGHAPWDRVEAASEASGLAAWVASLPMGGDTLLSPGAATLSGGQRQLLALTAVMASGRSLLLLDEAMANLDWKRRTALAASPWLEGRTLIYASHDVAFDQSDPIRVPGLEMGGGTDSKGPGGPP